MIEGSFDTRTLAIMNVALDLVCEKDPHGEQHEVRKRVAQAIIRCAKSGKTTLNALTEAGERVLTRLSGKRCLANPLRRYRARRGALPPMLSCRRQRRSRLVGVRSRSINVKEIRRHLPSNARRELSFLAIATNVRMLVLWSRRFAPFAAAPTHATFRV
jgi:hypothetical protein